MHRLEDELGVPRFLLRKEELEVRWKATKTAGFSVHVPGHATPLMHVYEEGRLDFSKKLAASLAPSGSKRYSKVSVTSRTSR